MIYPFNKTAMQLLRQSITIISVNTNYLFHFTVNDRNVCFQSDTINLSELAFPYRKQSDTCSKRRKLKEKY